MRLKCLFPGTTLYSESLQTMPLNNWNYNDQHLVSKMSLCCFLYFRFLVFCPSFSSSILTQFPIFFQSFYNIFFYPLRILDLCILQLTIPSALTHTNKYLILYPYTPILPALYCSSRNTLPSLSARTIRANRYHREAHGVSSALLMGDAAHSTGGTLGQVIVIIYKQ